MNLFNKVSIGDTVWFNSQEHVVSGKEICSYYGQIIYLTGKIDRKLRSFTQWDDLSLTSPIVSPLKYISNA